MQTTTNVSAFVGNIPINYDKYMGPMLMKPYAEDLAERVAATNPANVLELAAGTGILTEELAKRLPNSRIVATDLNQDMLNRAMEVRPHQNVEWKASDAQTLAFADNSFDSVAMQFGYMFIPDPAAAFREVFRVLRPGGRFWFNVWDDVPANDMAEEAMHALTDLVEPGPPSFLKVPFGSSDTGPILEQMRSAGFQTSDPIRVAKTSESETARFAATGMVLGTPLFGAIMENHKDPDVIAGSLEQAFIARFGDRPMRSKMVAIVLEGSKP